MRMENLLWALKEARRRFQIGLILQMFHWIWKCFNMRLQGVRVSAKTASKEDFVDCSDFSLSVAASPNKESRGERRDTTEHPQKTNPEHPLHHKIRGRTTGWSQHLASCRWTETEGSVCVYQCVIQEKQETQNRDLNSTFCYFQKFLSWIKMIVKTFGLQITIIFFNYSIHHLINAHYHNFLKQNCTYISVNCCLTITSK